MGTFIYSTRVTGLRRAGAFALDGEPSAVRNKNLALKIDGKRQAWTLKSACCTDAAAQAKPH